MAKKSEALAEKKTAEVPSAVGRFVESVRAEAEGALGRVRAFEIVGPDGLATADRALNAIAKQRDEWDAERKSFVGPLKDVAKRIDQAFKTILDPLDLAERELKAKIGAHALAERKDRERLLAEAAKAAREGDDAAAEALVVAAVPPPPPDDAKASARIEWTGQVVDAAAIPRQYLVPDVAALEALTRAAGRDPQIPGWQAYERAVVRTSRR